MNKIDKFLLYFSQEIEQKSYHSKPDIYTLKYPLYSQVILAYNISFMLQQFLTFDCCMLGRTR